MKKLLATLAAVVFAGASWAAAPNSSFVRGRSFDTNVAYPIPAPAPSTLNKPAYLVPVQDPNTGAQITRIGGNSSDIIPGFGSNGTATDSVWGNDSRHHYSKTPAWSAGESWLWLQNGRNMADIGPLTAQRNLILNGSTYVVDAVKSRYPVIRDSMSEMRPHPLWDNVAYIHTGTKAPSGKTMVLMFDMLRGQVLKRYILPVAGATWQSEGGISDDGRYSVFCKASGDTAVPDILVFVDFYSGDGTTGGGVYDSAGTAHAGLGKMDTTSVAWATRAYDDHATPVPLCLSETNVSTKGNYVILKYGSPNSTCGNGSGSPQYSRVLARGTSAIAANAAVDTTTLKLRPQTMDPLSLRVARTTDATDGWIVPVSHGSMNEDSLGNEVWVGGMRVGSYATNVSPTAREGGWVESTSQKDSGEVIAIYLTNGEHYHISPGRKMLSGQNEADFEHGSGASGLRGWVHVSYANGVKQLGRPFNNQSVWWKISKNTRSTRYRSGWEMGNIHTHSVPGVLTGSPCGPDCESGSIGDCYRQEPHGSPSTSGTRVAVASNWKWFATVRGECYEAKSYVIDSRGTSPTVSFVEYWVSPTGSDLNDGLSSSKAWRTIAKANATVQAVNYSVRVNLANNGGGYTDLPNPATAAANGYRYAFVGNLATPSLCVLKPASASTITKSYLTVKGVRFNGNLTLDGVRRDSIADVIVSQGSVSIAGSDCMVARVTQAGGRYFRIGIPTAGANRSVRDTIQECDITVALANNETARQSPFQIGKDGIATTAANNRYVDSCLVRFNRVRSNVANSAPTAATSNIPALLIARTKNTTLAYNRWDLTGSPTNPRAVAVMDSAITVAFNRDTIIAHGEGGDIGLAYSGLVTGVGVDSCYFSTYRGCPALFVAGATGATVTRSSFISGMAGPAMIVNTTSGSTFDHNTFVSEAAHFGAVYIYASTGTDTSKFYNNILSTPRFTGRVGKSIGQSALKHSGLRVQTPYVTGGAFKSNWNLYSVFGHYINEGDASISWTGGAQGSVAPHEGDAWRDLMQAHRIDADSLSVWGGADFDAGGADTVFRRTPDYEAGDSLFSTRIGDRSIGIALGKDGTDIGAHAAIVAPSAVLGGANVSIFTTQASVPVTGTIAIRNAGTGTLTLSGIQSSSSLLTAEVDDATLTAGQTAVITCTLTPTNAASFGVYAITLTTTDPVRPTIAFQVLQNILISPVETAEALPPTYQFQIE